ncbi:MAG: hypothetical protein ACK5P7_03235 [Bdellovibrio sp.]|jgi:hypothetical protein
MNSNSLGRYLPLIFTWAIAILLFQNCGKSSFETIEMESGKFVLTSISPPIDGVDLSHGKIFYLTRRGGANGTLVREAEVYLDFNTVTTRNADPLCFGQSPLTNVSRTALENHFLAMVDNQELIQAEIQSRAPTADVQFIILAESNAQFVAGQVPVGQRFDMGSSSNTTLKPFLDAFIASPVDTACQ